MLHIGTFLDKHKDASPEKLQLRLLALKNYTTVHLSGDDCVY